MRVRRLIWSRCLRKLAELKANGLVINNDPFLSAHSKQLAELALRHLVPPAH